MEYRKRHEQRTGDWPQETDSSPRIRTRMVGIAGLLLACQLLAQDAPPGDAAKQPAPKADDQAGPKQPLPAAYRFDVSLPITGKAVANRVEQALRKLPAAAGRPVFVFEFRPAAETAGEGSNFFDALALASFLTSDQLSQVRKVAWVQGKVRGHAVLPILACESIVMSKDADLGGAGTQEPVDDIRRQAYSEIAKRRLTIPPAVALGFLDKNLAVRKVTIDKKVRYETPEAVAELRKQFGQVDEEQFFAPGDEHVLSAQAMRHAPGFSVLLADDQRSLAAALQLPPAAFQRDLAPAEGWRPVRVDLHAPVHRQAVNRLLRSLDDHFRRGEFNLLLISIDSAGGDLLQSRRLAAHLAGLGKNVHTVAFVDAQARGDAALVALACDELVIHPDATLGGPGEVRLSRDDLNAIRPALPEIFGPLGRDWSLPLALIDPDVEVHRYHHSLGGEVRYLSPEEHESLENLPDFDQWKRGRPIQTSRGLTGAEAEELGLARATAKSFDELKSLYQLEGQLPQIGPNWALALVEWLSDPKIAGVLLFVGWFALMFEMSTPGVGAPGFVAIVCFLLYFWSQFLHGTAGWLEILLFVGGLACLSIEIFVMPGLGVFGVGGALMVIVSIVLASQTFVVPTNVYQLKQFPVSLLMVAAGMAGGIASIYVIRRFLPDTPYFNRMLLSPPLPEERAALSRRESLVIWEHLLNKRGITITPLVPAGKAQFGDDLVDCVSNGELIAKGTPVVVEEVAGNRVVVRKVNL